MFMIANLLTAVAQVLEVGLSILYWIIIIRALISWVNPDPYNPIVRMLQSVSEPILGQIRRILPFSLNLGVDISPIIAILAIMFVKSFLVRTLLDISFRLK